MNAAVKDGLRRTRYKAQLRFYLDHYGATALGSLTEPRDPAEYVHLLNTARLDESVLDGDAPVYLALCSYRWQKRPALVSIHGTDPGDELCPACYVLAHWPQHDEGDAA